MALRNLALTSSPAPTEDETTDEPGRVVDACCRRDVGSAVQDYRDVDEARPGIGPLLDGEIDRYGQESAKEQKVEKRLVYRVGTQETARPDHTPTGN